MVVLAAVRLSKSSALDHEPPPSISSFHRGSAAKAPDGMDSVELEWASQVYVTVTDPQSGASECDSVPMLSGRSRILKREP